MVHPSAASLRPSFFWSISIVAAICYLTSFQIRTRRIDPALEKLPLDPSDSAALAAWRTGTLLADVTLESVLLFGVMLYVFGATAGQAAPFFVIPFLTMLFFVSEAAVAERVSEGGIAWTCCYPMITSNFAVFRGGTSFSNRR